MKPQVGNTVVKTYRSVGNRTDLANGDNFYLKYVYNEAAILNDSEFKFYFIGLLAADGYISDKSNCIELCLKESDKDLLTILRDILVPGKNLVYKEKQKAYRLAIVNKVIADEVKRFINPSNKTFSLIFPYGIPDQYAKDFIRGYIDGDGNISVKQGQRKFEQRTQYYYGTRLRVLGTRAFLLGLVANLQRLVDRDLNVNVHRKQQENIFYIELGFSRADRILNYLYKGATYFLKRKHEVFQFISNADSSVLAKNYGTPDGCYNMQESTKPSG